MPQVTKGGKYIFGWSKINKDLTIRLPQMAIDEYNITLENKVYLMSGSKSTGGFCVTKKELLYNSKIGNILKDTPYLCDYKIPEGEFVKYKGRIYCWLSITQNGVLQFSHKILDNLSLKVDDKLLSIRSSDIAFTMGVVQKILKEILKFIKIRIMCKLIHQVYHLQY